VQWASGLSTATDLAVALAQTITGIETTLGSSRPDVVFAFASPSYGDGALDLPQSIRATWPGTRVLGCGAAGVIGHGREVEGGTALSLTAAVLPNVELQTFHLLPEGIPAPQASAWRRRLQIDQDPHFVVVPDPVTFRSAALLANLDEAYPATVKVGGLASGATEPGQTLLFVDGAVHRRGAVGLALAGNVALDAVVCQGCRPIGQPLFVTRTHDNMILELDGRRPSQVVGELWRDLGPLDRELAISSLLLGLVMRPTREVYRQGDFLVRNILGIDQRTGALAVAAQVPPNTVVQFHLRDAETSAADVESALGRYAADASHAPGGALMFSCLGRGEGLYGRPDHDALAFARLLGPVPLGGFFGNGEIGPVQGTTHLHGYTSVFGMFSALDRN
jgi:small ligand-binding sensory domain FIST